MPVGLRLGELFMNWIRELPLKNLFININFDEMI